MIHPGFKSHKADRGYIPPGAALSDREYDFDGLLTFAEAMERSGMVRSILSGYIRRGRIRVVRTPIGMLYEETDVDRLRRGR